MARLRANFQRGTITDNPLTSTATTINSAEFASLPAVVAPDTMALSLDYRSVGGAPEIVLVTAHAAAATSLTVTRGTEGTTARQHATATQWSHAPTAADFVFGSVITLGYAESSTTVSGIVAATHVLTVTVTVAAGRRVRISGVANIQRTVADGISLVSVMEGSTHLFHAVKMGTTEETINPVAVESPSAGAHTYTLMVQTLTGTGSTTVASGGNSPFHLLVEDITGDPTAVLPGSVPVGLLAQTAIPTQVSTFSADTQVASLNFTVPAGRTIRVMAHAEFATQTAGDTGVAMEVKESTTVLAQSTVTAPATGSQDAIEVTAILSPSAGAHTYTLNMRRFFGTGTITVYTAWSSFTVEDITATPQAASTAPSSTLGYAEVTADQLTITADTDLTGLASTVTVAAGRRIRITGRARLSHSAADANIRLAIMEGATRIAYAEQHIPIAANGFHYTVTAVVAPTAGTHTYKLQVDHFTAGTGNMHANATDPAYILVEDITAQSVVGASVSPSALGSEPWLDWIPALTQGVAVTKTVARARYTRIGRTVIAQFSLAATSAGTAGQNVIVGLPVAAAVGSGVMLGAAHFYDASAATRYVIVADLASSTTVWFVHDTGGGNVFGVTPGVTLASGDEIRGTFTYEAAS